MKYLYFLLALSFASCGSVRTINKLSNSDLDKVETTAFHTVIPFDYGDNKSIILNVKLGEDTTNYYFKLDNHAPTSIDAAYIDSINFKFLGALKLNKKTPTGDKFSQKYYTLNMLHIGTIKIEKVVFLALPSQKALNKQYVGLLGSNVLPKGALLIDFENKNVQFANSIDSFGIKNDKTQVSAKFTFSDNIKFNDININNQRIKLELDLGYNAGIMLDKNNFDKVDVKKNATIRTGTSTTVSGITKSIYKVLDSANVNISGKTVLIRVVNSDVIKNSNLIGLGFFSRFKYIIIDFPNKKFYVSKELRTTHESE